VAEVAVVGAPHEKWGEVPIAFVRLNPGHDVGDDELRDAALEQLARFKVPKRIVTVDDPPKTGTGKIQKYILREQAREGRYVP